MSDKKNGSIRIVHVSDMHVDEWNHCLEEEVNALAKDISENFHDVDYIVITGDISSSGKPAQFDIVAEKILPRLRSAAHVAAKKIIIVPGNHDINRCVAKEVEKEAVGNLHKGKGCAEKLFLEIAPSSVLSDYRSFIRNTGAMKGLIEEGCFCTLVMPTPRSYVGNVSFSCFNTAWSCLEDANKGEIFITQNQFDITCNKMAKDGIKIAVLHHDLEWMHDSEARIVDQMAAVFDIVLMGHIHRESTTLKRSPDSEVLLLTGTAFANDSNTEYLGYNVYDISPADSNVTTYYRKYSSVRSKFIPYNERHDEGFSILPYRSSVPLLSTSGKPMAYTYLPTVKSDHIVAQLKKAQGLDRPVYIPPALELVSMKNCCEETSSIGLEKFLEKEVLLFARRECGKTIFLEKLSLENNEVVYFDCRDIPRKQDSAEMYFETVLQEKLGNRTVDNTVILLDHLKIDDSTELVVLRKVLARWGKIDALVVSTNSNILFNSALSNKSVASFRKVRMRPWGVKAVEEFAVKFWKEKFPGQVPRIDYLKTCLEHSDLPINPVIVGVFVSMYAMTGVGGNNVNLTMLMERIADFRFSTDKKDYLAILTEFACELHSQNADRLTIELLRRLISNYYESKNLDYNGERVLNSLIDSKFIIIENNQWVAFPYYVFRDYFIANAIRLRKLSLDNLTSTDVNILANASPLILYGAIERDNTLILEKLFSSLMKICDKHKDFNFDFDALDGFITYLYFPRQANVAEAQNGVEKERKRRNQYKALQDEFDDNRKRHEQYRKTQEKVASAGAIYRESFLERLIFMLNAVYNLYRNLETLDAKHKERYLSLILDFHVYCNFMIIQSFKDLMKDKEFKSIIAYAVTIGGEVFLRQELFAPTLRKTICNVLQTEKNDFKKFLLISLYATGRFDGYEQLLSQMACETKSWAAIEMIYFKVRQLTITCKEENIPDELMEVFRTVVRRRNEIFKKRSNDISGEITSVKNSHYTNFHWEDKSLK